MVYSLFRSQDFWCFLYECFQFCENICIKDQCPKPFEKFFELTNPFYQFLPEQLFKYFVHSLDSSRYRWLISFNKLQSHIQEYFLLFLYIYRGFLLFCQVHLLLSMLCIVVCSFCSTSSCNNRNVKSYHLSIEIILILGLGFGFSFCTGFGFTTVRARHFAFNCRHCSTM